MSNKIDRKKTFNNDVIILNGLWGVGKSLLSPILSSLEGVEKTKIEYIYEYLCTLSYLCKIEDDACITLLKTYADISQYNNLIGREVNLRWNDDTGLKNSPNSFKYIMRMFRKDEDLVINEINENNYALCIMTHMITLAPDPIVDAFGDRLKIIEVVRHPLYLVRHIYSYLERFESEKIFTIAFDYKKNEVPWFASTWKDKFVKMTLMDRVLYSIIFCYEELFKSLDALEEKNVNLLVVPFESATLDTKNFLKSLEIFTGRGFSKSIKRTLKRQKIPRKNINQGLGYVKYGNVFNRNMTEKEDYKERWNSALEGGSKSNIEEFNKLIDRYNKKWPSQLNRYR